MLHKKPQKLLSQNIRGGQLLYLLNQTHPPSNKNFTSLALATLVYAFSDDT